LLYYSSDKWVELRCLILLIFLDYECTNDLRKCIPTLGSGNPLNGGLGIGGKATDHFHFGAMGPPQVSPMTSAQISFESSTTPLSTSTISSCSKSHNGSREGKGSAKMRLRQVTKTKVSQGRRRKNKHPWPESRIHLWEKGAVRPCSFDQWSTKGSWTALMYTYHVYIHDSMAHSGSLHSQIDAKLCCCRSNLRVPSSALNVMIQKSNTCQGRIG